VSLGEPKEEGAMRLRARLPLRPHVQRRAEALKAVIHKQAEGECWLRTLLERRKLPS
jgi:hypothetical protein